MHLLCAEPDKDRKGEAGIQYVSRARSLKHSTMLTRTVTMTTNEGTRQKQDHSESEGQWERKLCLRGSSRSRIVSHSQPF